MILKKLICMNENLISSTLITFQVNNLSSQLMFSSCNIFQNNYLI